MSLHFYIVGEDDEKEESIDNYKDLFIEYVNNPPSLEEALNQIFISGGVPEKEVNDYIKDITDKIEKIIKVRESKIKEKYPDISHNDSQIICSYTQEAKDSEYSPYRTLNRKLVTDNRKEGLKKVSKYLYILLKALRKLKRYYPSEEQKYLYRGIRFQVNTKIDPYKPKLVPYLVNKQKCFWAFTSTSPLQSTAFTFLDDNGYHNEKISKKGTFFSLYGKVWGYDITLFNSYSEEEILLEPERKFRIENVISDANDIIIATCEIIDSPIVLNDLKNKKDSLNYEPDIHFGLYNYSQLQNKKDSLDYEPQLQKQIQLPKQIYNQMKDSNGVFDIFGSVMGQLEMYISRDGHAINKQKLSPYFNCNYNNYKYMDKNELFLSLLNNIKLFEEKYFQFIEKYGKFEFPQDFQKNEAVQCLHYFSQSTEEGKIKKIISTILEILIKGKKPSCLSHFIEMEKKLLAPNRNYIQNLMYKEPLKLKEEKNYKDYNLNSIKKKSYGFKYSEGDFL